MHNDQLDDLKDFIRTTVGQVDARLGEVEERLSGEIQGLRTDMNDGFAGVGEAIEQLHAQQDERDAVVDKRLTALQEAA